MQAWRLVAHEGCGLCVDAMRRLADHLVGAPVTVQVLDAQAAPPDVAHAAPALLDPQNHVVWHGLFDEDATRAAFAREQRLRRQAALPPVPPAAAST